MLRMLARSKGNVFGLETSGMITAADIEGVTPVLDEAIRQYGRINWLMVMRNPPVATVRAMYADMMWLLKNLKHFDRMAVVGDRKWEELLVKADGLVFGEKYFDISELEKAWTYVEGGAA